MIALLGLVVGIVLGLVFQPDVPVWLCSPTCPSPSWPPSTPSSAACGRCLDGIFDDKVFVVSFLSNVVIAGGHRLPRRQARRRRTALHRSHRGARHPHLLQRRGDPEAPVPCLSPKRPRSVETEAGPDRLRAALLRPSRGQVVVGVLLAVLGFAAVTQVRANEVDNTYASYREQDLIDVLNTMTDATARAQSELARLESARRDLRSETSQRAAARVQAQQAVDTLNVLAGNVPVTGPGIRITVTESDGPGGRELHPRHRPGAPDRGRGGDGVQRRGAHRRPELLRRRRWAA